MVIWGQKKGGGAGGITGNLPSTFNTLGSESGNSAGHGFTGTVPSDDHCASHKHTHLTDVESLEGGERTTLCRCAV